MRKIVFGFAVVAAVASALAQAVAPAIENEEQAYGAVYGRIVECREVSGGSDPIGGVEVVE